MLSDPLIWSEEVARYLFVWVSMIGAALAIREGGHFGLDLLIRPFPQLKPVVGPLVTLVMVVFLAVLFKTGIDETRLASMQYAMTFEMRMTWAYLALPVGAGLMLFHIAIHVIRAPCVHILDVREPHAPSSPALGASGERRAVRDAGARALCRLHRYRRSDRLCAGCRGAGGPVAL